MRRHLHKEWQWPQPAPASKDPHRLRGAACPAGSVDLAGLALPRGFQNQNVNILLLCKSETMKQRFKLRVTPTFRFSEQGHNQGRLQLLPHVCSAFGTF